MSFNISTVFRDASLILIMCLVSGQLQASPVTFKFDSFGRAGSVNVFAGDQVINNLSIGTINVTTLFRDDMPLSGEEIVTFCTEIQESIGAGQTYTYQAVETQYASSGTAGPPGAGSGIPFGGIGPTAARNIAILYDLYYAGQSSSDWSSDNAGAFQLAVWELTHDNDGSLYNQDGFFYRTGGSKSTFRLAQSYVDDVLGMDEAYNPYTELVALSSIGDPGRQDLLIHAAAIGGGLTEVPFGVNPLPALALCGLIGYNRLRKRMAARSALLGAEQ
ncbi:MAG: hypothetical protein AAGA45_04620 [Verrucomicrobiota bacterium]